MPPPTTRSGTTITTTTQEEEDEKEEKEEREEKERNKAPLSRHRSCRITNSTSHDHPNTVQLSYYHIDVFALSESTILISKLSD